MSAVVDSSGALLSAPSEALLAGFAGDRPFAWREGKAVCVSAFLADVRAVAESLPAGGHAINLCEDRYAFITSFCAVAALGQTTLLPSSRARQAIDDALALHADAYVISDVALDPAPRRLIVLPTLTGEREDRGEAPRAPAVTQTVAIGFTSGSTGMPKPNAKTWGSVAASSALNAAVLAESMRLEPGQIASIVATVPSQHMYGMEMSVLLPLFGPFAVHSAKPFFPSDIARALSEMPAPRLLVTTPVHLRNLLRDETELPPIAAIVSATAPLDAALAQQAEQRFGAPMIELFGSTETCVIAHRRTAVDSEWQLHPGIELRPQPDGTLVGAAHLGAGVHLQDVVELVGIDRFHLRGRNADLLDIAGKRASLADLTRRLLGLPGVVDGVVFQLEEADACGVRRIAALVVAPGRSSGELLCALRDQVDPVFLPRPLRCVETLPRNETGKLPRSALIALINGGKASSAG